MSETNVEDYDAYLKEKMGVVFGLVKCSNGDFFVTSIPSAFEGDKANPDFKLMARDLLYSEANALFKVMEKCNGDQ